MKKKMTKIKIKKIKQNNQVLQRKNEQVNV